MSKNIETTIMLVIGAAAVLCVMIFGVIPGGPPATGNGGLPVEGTLGAVAGLLLNP